jgi:hypothetical protein
VGRSGPVDCLARRGSKGSDALTCDAALALTSRGSPRTSVLSNGQWSRGCARARPRYAAWGPPRRREGPSAARLGTGRGPRLGTIVAGRRTASKSSRIPSSGRRSRARSVRGGWTGRAVKSSRCSILRRTASGGDIRPNLATGEAAGDPADGWGDCRHALLVGGISPVGISSGTATSPIVKLAHEPSSTLGTPNPHVWTR